MIFLLSFLKNYVDLFMGFLDPMVLLSMYVSHYVLTVK